MTTPAGAKAELLQQMGQEWQRLQEVGGKLTEEESLLPNAVGHWSARELLIHIAAWNDELVNVVERFQGRGERADYGDDEAVDRLNEAQVEEKRALSVSQAWDELHQSYRRMAEFLQGLPEEAFAPGTYTEGQIAMESVGHYREHRGDLERWQESRDDGH